MGETRVDLVHLLEDLRDAYPGSLEETILTEIVANALDSGAGRLRIQVDAAAATLIAADDGAGMTRRELSRYHDLATTSKKRGRGIGFAGVGIKLGLLASDVVITETWKGRQRAATSWNLANRSRAPWTWIEPPGHLTADGTAVVLRLSNPLSQLLDPGFLEATVLRNYQPLFEPEFVEVLEPYYPDGMTIRINDRVVVGPIRSSDRVPVALRVGRRRKPAAVGYLARHDEPLPEPERGLAISTLGKVIRRGWDWIGLTPADGDRVEGLIEVPGLAEALTLNKGDFLRTGARGALYLSFRKAIQEAVSEQLTAWGEPPNPRRQARTRPMERDLDRVLGELAADFPLLAAITERRSGGQKRLPFGEPGPGGAGLQAQDLWGGGDPLGEAGGGAEGRPQGADSAADPSSGGDRKEPEARPEASPPSEPLGGETRVPSRSGRKKSARLTIQIRFEARPGDERLGRLIESTVWVNDAHPAYRRAVGSRSEGYHIAVAVAAALAPLTVEADRFQQFLQAFLVRWGEAGGSRK